MNHRAKWAAATAVGLLCVSATAISVAEAATPTKTNALREAVTLEGVRAHQAVWQDIADANGGTREAASAGYRQSVDYVVAQLEAAGYEPEVQEFDYEQFLDLSAPTLVFDGSGPIVADEDFATMTYSASGNLTGAATVGVDLALADPASSSSGCEASDFDGVDVVGKIAVLQRGACTFALKAINAEAAGAAAAVVFNQGNTPEREGMFFGTLGDPGQVTIPVLSATYAVGTGLVAAGTASLSADVELRTSTSYNVLAETSGRDDRVVVVGAHLDSVIEGPGINDNGSGSAVILEVALQMAELGIEPVNQVRFAWWGAEEAGLLGSEHYVANLSKREIKNIALNLNFDMIGSPNFVRFVYDGDGSATPLAGPNGSGVIEDVFTDYFDSQGLDHEPTAFSGRSDYGPFIAVGIPAGGLFTGAEGIKTEEQVGIYGGSAGDQYDPCYHLACDTFDNVSLEVLDEMADAVAHATLTFAMTTSSVNGTDKANAKSIDKSASMEFRGSAAQR